MNRGKVRDFNQIFLLSFIVLTLKLTYMSIDAFLPIILLSKYTIIEYTIFRNIKDIIGVLLSASIIVAGYWFGKKADLANHYMDFIRAMVYSWILAELLAGVGWVLTDSMFRTFFEAALANGLRGYIYFTPLFSGITLGWLVKERFTVKPVWSEDVLRYVLIYQGALLARSVIGVYLSKTLLYSSHQPVAVYGLYSTVLSLILLPVSLWFLWKMFEAGKQVELGAVYGSILYTLWALSVAGGIIGSIARMVILSQLDAWDLLLVIGKGVLGDSIGVFGNAFAVLCFGYLNSRKVNTETMDRI